MIVGAFFLIMRECEGKRIYRKVWSTLSQCIIGRRVLCFFRLIGSLFFLSGFLGAHQPILVEDQEISIEDLFAAQAYYAVANRKPQQYRFSIEDPAIVHLSFLIPDFHQKSLYASLVRNDASSLFFFQGDQASWEKFYEPFAGDTYWRGGRYIKKLDRGEYILYVWSRRKNIRYILAIGTEERFDFLTIAKMILSVPRIKYSFFHRSPMTFLWSILGITYFLMMAVVAFCIHLCCRLLLKQWFPERETGRFVERILIFVLGMVVALGALASTWNPFLLFLAWFCVIESLSPSFCGLWRRSL